MYTRFNSSACVVFTRRAAFMTEASIVSPWSGLLVKSTCIKAMFNGKLLIHHLKTRAFSK